MLRALIGASNFVSRERQTRAAILKTIVVQRPIDSSVGAVPVSDTRQRSSHRGFFEGFGASVH